MANTRQLRRRIKSVQNTSQITHAMEMVAAQKMRKAQNQAVSGRAYSQELSWALERLLPRVDIEAHPLLDVKRSATSDIHRIHHDDRVGVILLSTDKGLVGALNTNLMRMILTAHLSGGNVVFYTVGRKGRNFVIRTRQDLQADFENVDTISFKLAVQLTKLITESFISGELGEVYLVYPHFVSTLRQEPKKIKLLPIDISSLVDSLTPQDYEKRASEQTSSEFLFEPDVDTLLDFILIHHVQIKIYQALLETKASEHSARMVAMKNATDNAKELVEDLRLTYNQIRQETITKEILEITTAQIAM